VAKLGHMITHHAEWMTLANGLEAITHLCAEDIDMGFGLPDRGSRTAVTNSLARRWIEA